MKISIGDYVECHNQSGMVYHGVVYHLGAHDCRVVVLEVVKNPCFRRVTSYAFRTGFKDAEEKLGIKLPCVKDNSHPGGYFDTTQYLLSEPYYLAYKDEGSEWVAKVLGKWDGTSEKQTQEQQHQDFFLDRKAEAMKGIDPGSGETIAAKKRGGGLMFL